MEQQSVQTPSNPFYVNELINTVNNNPNPKNVLKMQQVLNQFHLDTGFGGTPLKEDGVLGKKTQSAVKSFRGYQELIKTEEDKLKREEFDKNLEMQREQYDKDRLKRFGRAKDRISVFDMIKGDEEFDLRKEMEKDK